MIPDRVWNNYKQMLNNVLESKDSNIIAENSILVIPKLIDEIDSLRSRINGTTGSCTRERETVCVG